VFGNVERLPRHRCSVDVQRFIAKKAPGESRKDAASGFIFVFGFTYQISKHVGGVCTEIT
jgi:hypothetical protein